MKFLKILGYLVVILQTMFLPETSVITWATLGMAWWKTALIVSFFANIPIVIIFWPKFFLRFKLAQKIIEKINAKIHKKNENKLSNWIKGLGYGGIATGALIPAVPLARLEAIGMAIFIGTPQAKIMFIVCEEMRIFMEAYIVFQGIKLF